MSQVSAICRLFDLPSRDGRFETPTDCFLDQLIPREGQVVFLTGPSGSGKSRLLRALVGRMKQRGQCVLDPTQVTWPDAAVIDCIHLPDLQDRLKLLSRVGLADAWSFVQKPTELSDGQRWRLVLAMLLVRAEQTRGPVVIVMDEFASLLDRVTAAIVARSLRKLLDAGAFRAGVVVATAHDDIARALRADCVVTCDFGQFHVEKGANDVRSNQSSTG